MQKTKRILALACACIIFTSCANETSSNISGSHGSSAPALLAESLREEDVHQFHDMLMFDINSKSSIEYSVIAKQLEFKDFNVTYPQIMLTSGNENSEVNEIIINRTKSLLESYKGPTFDVTSIDYKIAWANDSFISIVFFGTYQNERLYEILHTINIDLENKKVVRLDDVFYLDSYFANIFRRNFIKQFSEYLSGYADSGEEFLDRLSEGDLLSYLQTCDNANGGINSYFTNEGVVIKYWTLGVLGDYFETFIDYDSIQNILNYDSSGNQLPSSGVKSEELLRMIRKD